MRIQACGAVFDEMVEAARASADARGIGCFNGVVKAASQLGDSFPNALNRLRQISHGVGV